MSLCWPFSAPQTPRDSLSPPLSRASPPSIPLSQFPSLSSSLSASKHSPAVPLLTFLCHSVLLPLPLVFPDTPLPVPVFILASGPSLFCFLSLSFLSLSPCCSLFPPFSLDPHVQPLTSFVHCSVFLAIAVVPLFCSLSNPLDHPCPAPYVVLSLCPAVCLSIFSLLVSFFFALPPFVLQSPWLQEATIPYGMDGQRE